MALRNIFRKFNLATKSKSFRKASSLSLRSKNLSNIFSPNVIISVYKEFKFFFKGVEGGGGKKFSPLVTN